VVYILQLHRNDDDYIQNSSVVLTAAVLLYHEYRIVSILVIKQ